MFEVCTTIHTDGYDQYAKNNFKSFVDFWPNNITLHAFMEGPYDPIISHKIKYYDFFKEEPELKNFLERNQNRVWKPKEKLKSYKTNWKKFCFKSFAMYRASQIIKSNYLIWLDADIITTDKFQIDEMNRYIDPSKFCSYLNRDKHLKNNLGMRHLLSSETGFIIFNLKHSYSTEFFDRFISYYKTDKIFDLYEVTDNFLLDKILKEMEIENKIKNIKMVDGTSENPLKHTSLGRFLFHRMGNKKWK